MKRTRKPSGRRKILSQDIDLDLKEKHGKPHQIAIKLSGMGKYDFPDSARVSLEISNADTHSQIANLGEASLLLDDFVREIGLDEAFAESERRLIKCSLRVFDPNDSRLLGLAEKLRMKGGQESLLGVEMCDDMQGVFEIDWADRDSLILRCNSEIDQKNWDAIYPIIGESLYREILTRTLIEAGDGVDDEELLENEWVKLAGPDSDSLVGARARGDNSEIYDIISKVSRKFAVNHRLVKQAKKGINSLKK